MATATITESVTTAGAASARDAAVGLEVAPRRPATTLTRTAGRIPGLVPSKQLDVEHRSGSLRAVANKVGRSRGGGLGAYRAGHAARSSSSSRE